MTAATLARFEPLGIAVYSWSGSARLVWLFTGEIPQFMSSARNTGFECSRRWLFAARTADRRVKALGYNVFVP
jgi:hypothetical protein